MSLPGFRAESAVGLPSGLYSGHCNSYASTGTSVVVPAIRRSCSGTFEVTSLQGLGKSSLLNFSARRGCGRFVPNRCRRRARDSLRACMRAAWRDRFVTGRPRECTHLGSVSDYPGGVGLAERVRRFTCALFANRSQSVIVRGITRGNTDCPSVTELGTLHVRCP